MKIVTVSANGIVIQTPATPISFGRISMNTATRIKERIDEISAEIKPFPKAVKYPERNTFKPINRKTGLNSFRPSHVNVNTFPLPTNKWMICFPNTSDTVRINTELMAIVIKLYHVISLILS